MTGSKPQPFNESIHPAEAARVLAQCYAERAGEEALFRALIAERDLNSPQARFWIRVYERLSLNRHHPV